MTGSLVDAVEGYKRFSDEIAGKIDLEVLAESLCAVQNVIAMLAAVSALGCVNGTQPTKSDDKKQAGAKEMQSEP